MHIDRQNCVVRPCQPTVETFRGENRLLYCEAVKKFAAKATASSPYLSDDDMYYNHAGQALTEKTPTQFLTQNTKGVPHDILEFSITTLLAMVCAILASTAVVHAGDRQEPQSLEHGTCLNFRIKKPETLSNVFECIAKKIEPRPKHGVWRFRFCVRTNTSRLARRSTMC